MSQKSQLNPFRWYRDADCWTGLMFLAFIGIQAAIVAVTMHWGADAVREFMRPMFMRVMAYLIVASLVSIGLTSIDSLRIPLTIVWAVIMIGSTVLCLLMSHVFAILHLGWIAIVIAAFTIGTVIIPVALCASILTGNWGDAGLLMGFILAGLICSAGQKCLDYGRDDA